MSHKIAHQIITGQALKIEIVNFQKYKQNTNCMISKTYYEIISDKPPRIKLKLELYQDDLKNNIRQFRKILEQIMLI